MNSEEKSEGMTSEESARARREKRARKRLEEKNRQPLTHSLAMQSYVTLYAALRAFLTVRLSNESEYNRYTITCLSEFEKELRRISEQADANEALRGVDLHIESTKNAVKRAEEETARLLEALQPSPDLSSELEKRIKGLEIVRAHKRNFATMTTYLLWMHNNGTLKLSRNGAKCGDVVGAEIDRLENDAVRLAIAEGARKEELEADPSEIPRYKLSDPDNFRKEDSFAVNSDADWPRMPDEQIQVLTEAEQTLLRLHEEEMIAGNAKELNDLITNCRSKLQFAKTYRVLRRDKRNLLAKLRQKQDVDLINGFTYYDALIRSTDRILSFKLERMSAYFKYCWGEPIDAWAGEEHSAIDQVGCMIWFLGLGVAVGGAIRSFIC
ncbi:MAG: hypothetical protein NXI32_26360 [bacterium]|nr:hypothetical protein [bacterium]